MSILSLITQLLRNPRNLVETHDSPNGLTQLTPSLLTIIAAGGSIFGAVTGSYRGGLQTFYAATKFPILLIIPMIITLPAVFALWRACTEQEDLSWRRLSLSGLVGLARTAILLAAVGPILWLGYSLQIDYHLAVVLMVAALGLVGLPGLSTVLSMLPGQGIMRWVATCGALGILSLTMAQTGWLLRPFVARPTVKISLYRPIEEDIFSSLGATVLASFGDYQDWDAESTGVLGRGVQ